MAKQLTISIENRPRWLQAPPEKLDESHIDIRAFTIWDRGDDGLLRLIVDKPSDIYPTLTEVGCACALKDVLAISVPDQPGNCHRLTAALAVKGLVSSMPADSFYSHPESRYAARRSTSRGWPRPRTWSGGRLCDHGR